jgi:hypothetical protein
MIFDSMPTTDTRVRYHGLSDWWLSQLTEPERCVMNIDSIYNYTVNCQTP